MPHVFLSYCHDNAREAAELHEALTERGFRIWWDQNILGGQDWKLERDRAMKQSYAVVACFSNEVERRNSSGNFPELRDAIEAYRDLEPGSMFIVPVRFSACKIPDLPIDANRKLTDLQYVDLFPPANWEAGIDQLANSLRSADLPLESPSIGSHTRSAFSSVISIGRLPVTSQHLFGRVGELEHLDQALDTANINVISVVGWGGVGKSALINRWLADLAKAGWRGAKRVFAWSFYSRHERQVLVRSSDQFIDCALRWFGDQNPLAGSAWERGERLAQLLQCDENSPSILILDGLEPLQNPPGAEEGRLRDPGMQSLLRALAAHHNGLCVVTTRFSVQDLATYENGTVHTLKLEHLPEQACVELLRSMDVEGDDQQLREAAVEFGRHALALNLLGTFLRDACERDVRRFGEVRLLEEDAAQGGHAKRVMAAYEDWFGEGTELAFLRILGLFDGPTRAGELETLLESPVIPGLTDGIVDMGTAELKHAIARLRRARLVMQVHPHSPFEIDAHPLVREYFGQRLHDDSPNAWKLGHERLYRYIKQTTTRLPSSLDEMMPLYSAIAHGCHAGHHREALKEVYWRRIRRGDQHYSTKVLGAYSSDLSAISCFFERPWREPVQSLHADERAYVLGQAGFYLRSVGRLSEALPPLQASLESKVAVSDWINAARDAGNLCETCQALGQLVKARGFADESLQCARKAEDRSIEIIALAWQADVLHQLGQFSESRRLFEHAEKLHRSNEPARPLLYSSHGFTYFDFLLNRVEGVLWPVPPRRQRKLLKEVCVKLRGRSKSLRDSAKLALSKGRGGKLDIALSQLADGRLHLCRTMLSNDPDFSTAEESLNRAVALLRDAGTIDYVPLGYLARARLRLAQNRTDGALEDIHEAFDTALRNGMKLHEADCYLAFARCYITSDGEESSKAKENADLASRLIGEMGYRRRGPEITVLQSILK